MFSHDLAISWEMLRRLLVLKSFLNKITGFSISPENVKKLEMYRIVCKFIIKETSAQKAFITFFETLQSLMKKNFWHET